MDVLANAITFFIEMESNTPMSAFTKLNTAFGCLDQADKHKSVDMDILYSYKI
ncbi:MAG: hypothetical protein IPF52_07955 [Saprospiraceae bacterium]|nr:hypothetical protein [Saprospiraceae bacterium]